MAEDKGVTPKFFMDTYVDPAATDKEGRKVHRSREMVQIFFAGNPLSQPTFLVTDEHRTRWPEHYNLFKQGQEQIVGTPLDLLPWLKPERIADLHFLKIRTAEELAEVTDQNLQRLGMGAYEERNKARAFIKAAKDGAGLLVLAKENAELALSLKETQAQVAELKKLVEQLTPQEIKDKAA